MYILIRAVERDISIVSKTDNVEDAYKAMIDDLVRFSNDQITLEDCAASSCDTGDWGYDQEEAYLTDGYDGYNYDWKIVEIC